MLGNVLLDPYANRKNEDKRNICFETVPLADNWTVSGNPAVKIYLKPNGEDCSLFAYLEDVAPNGSVNYVTEGEILCGNNLSEMFKPKYKTLTPMRSFRKADYKPFAAGEVREVSIEMYPTSYQFKKGHRIRLSIAGRDKDHFETPAFARMGDQFEIVCGANHASQISLPVEADNFTLSGELLKDSR
jgi:putative CocE/NonD family hydrolase